MNGLLFGEQALLKFWESVVDPCGVGMPQAIAADISSFTGESIEDALAKMSTGKHDLKQLWESTSIDASNPESVAGFYRYQFTEAYELASWHCGQENGKPPLDYAYAAKFAQAKRLKRALDFGSGIGTGSLALAAAGCQVDSADIAYHLLRFVGHRMVRRCYIPRLIDLAHGERPLKAYYDLITCFDVLEHIPNQLATLRDLASYVRPGGYLLINLMKDSSDPDRPMHISSAGNWITLVRKTALVPDWSLRDIDIQILVRHSYGRIYNYAAAWGDWAQDRRNGLRIPPLSHQDP